MRSDRKAFSATGLILFVVWASAGVVYGVAGLSVPIYARDGNDNNAIVTLDKRQWTTQSNGAYIRWPDAVTYCADLRLGGHSDWRLPTLAELQSLYNPRAEQGIDVSLHISGCCLWSNTSLQERAAADDEEIAGRARRYRWGFMFDGGNTYYAGPYYEDGEALCTRDN